MISTHLYQTLEDKNNIKQILEKAPFKCTRKDAWLGEGYYFWDTSISNAHWWGKKGYKNKYIICETTGQYNRSEILDLAGNLEQLKDVREYTQILQSKKGCTLKVSAVLNFMRKHPSFKFKAIRAYPINSRNNADSHIHFKEGNKAYLDLDPPIQICVIDKTIIKTPIKIVYPEEYSEKYSKEFTI